MNSIYADTRQMFKVITEIYAEALASIDGVSVSDAHGLMVLADYGAMRANQLAAYMGYLPTSFTPAIDRLAALGLIERKPHATDRRSVQIALTPAGCEAVALIRPALEAAHRRCVDAFGSTEEPALRNFMTEYAPPIMLPVPMHQRLDQPY